MRTLETWADRLLTVAEVGELLGVKPAAVYALAECGALPHLRVSGAIRVRTAEFEALEAFIAARGPP